MINPFLLSIRNFSISNLNGSAANVSKIPYLTLGFHRDCGSVVIPIHHNAVNTAR